MTCERNIFEILSILDRGGGAMTSGEITAGLDNIGINLTERRVRHYLESLDDLGFTRNLGRGGREITGLGRGELKKTYIHGRSDFILDRIVRIITDTRFDVERVRGDVVVNLSFIEEDKEDRVRGILGEICSKSNLAPPFIKIARHGERLCNREIPEGKFGLATISSVTIEEILLNERIYVKPLYGGLVEFIDRKPVRFTELISYSGSSIDPLDLFISRRMSTVCDAVNRNYGSIPADYREVPYTARSRVIELLRKAVGIIGGLVVVGKTGVDVLGLNTKEGYTGVVGFGGELLLSALEECDIKTNTSTVDTVIDFNELEPISEVRGDVLLE